VIIPISHPDKVLFPEDGITKGEMAEYYETIAPVMLPHIIGRPVTMERFHRGIAAPGFFQKDVSKGFPSWLKRVEVPKHGGTVHHPVVTDARSLVWLANQNCITPHVWTRRASDLSHPDICVFDLDPPDDGRADVLRGVVLALRDLLGELGLTSWVKTTGSKGFHVTVALDGSADLPTAAHFADAVGTLFARRDPKHLTQEFYKDDRDGRILVDTGRNNYSATFAAAYAVRARPAAPISAPCTWKEVERGEVGPKTFTLRTMPARVASAGDPWADIATRAQPLDAAIERLRTLQGRLPSRPSPPPEPATAGSKPRSKPRGGRSGKSRGI
jgi:bifunctional non-homologous end joining protein LigD